jgi:tetratricopeptide (TPR) repeat protein
VFLHERNYAAAERVAIAQWTDEAGLRFTGWSAVAAARAEGDDEKMRTYALKARAAYEGLLDTPATEPVNLSEAGLLDVALGRRENGIAECRRAVELCPISRDALNGAECAVALAVAYAWSGERDRAIEQLRTVANVANGPSYGDLKFSPLWDSLRDDPRFEKILAEAAKPLPL